MTAMGFIGLGNMGGPMAANLARAGHTVRGFDLAPFDIAGVARADTLGEAVAGAEVVLTMLPNGAILRQVYHEAAPLAAPGALLLDCSTVDIASARFAHAEAERHGLLSLDAPVSGGIAGAAAGTLTFMAGGSEGALVKAEPLLALMGKRTVHCGGAGAGQAAKICNNMILGASMIAVCEAFVLGDRLGLDRQRLFDVVSTSSGSCWSVNTYCPAPGVGPQSPADNDYKPGFAAALMLKDLQLAQAAADDAGAPTPMGALAAKLYAEFVADGGGSQDFSAMLPRLGKIARGDA